MLVGTLGASLLGNMLAGKGIVRAGSGCRSLSAALQNSSPSYENKKRKKNCKSWLWKRMGFLMLSHPLTNFEIQKYCENEPRFIPEIICLKK